jgi:transposase-like protein
MQLVLQALIELEAGQAIGAARYERAESRLTHRNGSRGRLLSTKAGDVDLRIPKLRAGSFFPSLLEPRRRIDRALWAVIMEAYVHGVSTRKVDDLVTALGIEAGVSKSEVSRICAELDKLVGAFRRRRLEHVAFPYLFLDATYVKANDGASVVSKAVVVATGVTARGEREVLGCAVGDSEDGAFWTAFLRDLRRRGLGGVRLVVSDAHEGLKAAIGAVLLDAAWQRCRVHFLRNVLSHVPKASAQMVAEPGTVFERPSRRITHERLRRTAARASSDSKQRFLSSRGARRRGLAPRRSAPGVGVRVAGSSSCLRPRRCWWWQGRRQPSASSIPTSRNPSWRPLLRASGPGATASLQLTPANPSSSSSTSWATRTGRSTFSQEPTRQGAPPAPCSHLCTRYGSCQASAWTSSARRM